MAIRARSRDALIVDLRKWLLSGQTIVYQSTLDSFILNDNAFFAANWCIVCVGEAAGQILKHYPDFPNEELRKELLFANATRNRIAHGYYDLNIEQVWKTIADSFSMLSAMLEKYLIELNHEF